MQYNSFLLNKKIVNTIMNNNGFNRPIKIPKILFDFFECHFQTKDTNEVSFERLKNVKPRKVEQKLIIVDRLMKRPDITGLLMHYCLKNNLRLENDKRIIKCKKSFYRKRGL